MGQIVLSFDKYCIRESLNEAYSEGVKLLQTALKNKGYGNLLGTSGPTKDGVDGFAGPKTIAAVKAFQGANQLDVDGIVGPMTASKLGIKPISLSKAQTTQTQTTQPKIQSQSIKTIPTLNYRQNIQPSVDNVDPNGAYSNKRNIENQRMTEVLKSIETNVQAANSKNSTKVTTQEIQATNDEGSWLFKYLGAPLRLLPLHIRAMIYYLGGRKAPMTSSELTKDEQTYLYTVAQKYGSKGFNYPLWKSIGATNLPTAISAQGIQQETAKLKQLNKNGSDSLILPNLAGQFMYTLGAISPGNIIQNGNTIIIKDNYDMNVVQGGKTKEDIFNGIAKTFKLWTAGESTLYSLIRNTISLREITGYIGYPIEFSLTLNTNPTKSVTAE